MTHSTFGQTGGSSPIVISDAKIQIDVYTGLRISDENVSFDFYVTNLNKTQEQVRIVPSALAVKDALQFSQAPSYIGSDQVTILSDGKSLASQNNVVDIKGNDRVKIQYVIPKETVQKVGFNAAAYTGRVQIIDSGMRSTELEVQVSFHDSPWYYPIFVLIGISIAIGVGWRYTASEKRKAIEEQIEDDTAIISDINGHIRSINAIRHAIDSKVWNNIYQAFNEKKVAIEKYRNKIELDKDAEAVKWFETTDEFLKEKFLAPEELPKTDPVNPPLHEIMKPGGDEEYEKLKSIILKKRIHKQIQQDKKDVGKKIYAAGISIVSSIATILTAANFLGNTGLNIVVAGSIGFALYRSKDVLKLFPSSKGEGETAD